MLLRHSHYIYIVSSRYLSDCAHLTEVLFNYYYYSLHSMGQLTSWCMFAFIIFYLFSLNAIEFSPSFHTLLLLFLFCFEEAR